MLTVSRLYYIPRSVFERGIYYNALCHNNLMTAPLKTKTAGRGGLR